MIRGGLLCRGCNRGYCRADKDEGLEVGIECPVCDGIGCEACSDGEFKVAGCPNAYCSSIVPALELIDLFHKGMAPVAGGTLDQSASFIRVARLMESEEAKVSNERSSRNSD